MGTTNTPEALVKDRVLNMAGMDMLRRTYLVCADEDLPYFQLYVMKRDIHTDLYWIQDMEHRGCGVTGPYSLAEAEVEFEKMITCVTQGDSGRYKIESDWRKPA